jgi:hypothetical protein
VLRGDSVGGLSLFNALADVVHRHHAPSLCIIHDCQPALSGLATHHDTKAGKLMTNGELAHHNGIRGRDGWRMATQSGPESFQLDKVRARARCNLCQYGSHSLQHRIALFGRTLDNVDG